MATEANRIETWARIWDKLFRAEALKYQRANTALVIGAGFLAAAAATTGLTSALGGVGAGLLALAAAALSTIATGLRPSSVATQLNTAAAANTALADFARVFQATELPFLEMPDVESTFQKLCDMRNTVVQNAPVTKPPWKTRTKRLRRRAQTAERVSAWPPGLDPEG